MKLVTVGYGPAVWHGVVRGSDRLFVPVYNSMKQVVDSGIRGQ